MDNGKNHFIKGFEQVDMPLDIHVFNSSSTNTLKSYYSPTRFPKLKIKRKNTEYDIQVNMVSIEAEDRGLLHKLLTKTREIK